MAWAQVLVPLTYAGSALALADNTVTARRVLLWGVLGALRHVVFATREEAALPAVPAEAAGQPASRT